jgi:hypothetical protein
MAVLWSVVACHAKVSENGLVHRLKGGRTDRHSDPPRLLRFVKKNTLNI